MLESLRIKNLAVIDELEAGFGPGFTVLTGETGAGKSVLVGAVGLLLGERATPDLVRTGEKEASIEGVFSLEGSGRTVPEAYGGGCELCVRRVISADGRTKTYINGVSATVGAISALVSRELDISSQHAHQVLAREDSHGEILDAYACVADARAAYQRSRAAAADLVSRLNELKKGASERAVREDYLAFQLKEFRSVDPKEGEDEALAAERIILANAGRLSGAVTAAEELVYSADGSAYELARRAATRLADAASLDPRLEGAASLLEQAVISLDETASSIRGYLKGMDFSPERLEEVEDRLASIHRLVRKHAGSGGTLSGLIQRMEGLARELETIKTGEQRLPSLTAETASAINTCLESGALLSELRSKAAASFGREISKALKLLAMGGARFEARIANSPPSVESVLSLEKALPETGFDHVSFMFSANAGEDTRPLQKIASGGELSRTMLAVKSVLAGRDPVPLYIFDEVDAGIGGAVAEIVGSHLGRISRHHQVLCITHLPQVAALADTHMTVSKEEHGGRTSVTVRSIEGNDRVMEIARMLGGVRLTDATVAHAKEMLNR
jgi:DNA repair protein RecN (Recombination protein N)